MPCFVIKQTAFYEVNADNPAAALTAFLECEGANALLPVNVSERTVLDAETGEPDLVTCKCGADVDTSFRSQCDVCGRTVL